MGVFSDVPLAGTVTLGTHYGKGKVQIECSPIQACILQLFEKEKVISFESIMKQLWPEGQAAMKGGGSNLDTLMFALAPLVQTKVSPPLPASTLCCSSFCTGHFTATTQGRARGRQGGEGGQGGGR